MPRVRHTQLLFAIFVVTLFWIITISGSGETYPPLRYAQKFSDQFKYAGTLDFKESSQQADEQTPTNSESFTEILDDVDSHNLIVKHSKGETVVLVLASNGGGNQGDIEGLLEMVVEDRTSYAKRHGYGFFYTNTDRYNAGDMHPAWLKSKAISEAMMTFPKASWFWWLDQDAIIMTPSLSIEAALLNPKILGQKLLSLEKYIREGIPDAFSPEVYNLDKVDLIFSQDHNGLNTGSMLIRRSLWTDIVLDLWNNPDLVQATEFGKEQDLIRDLLVRHDTFRTHAGIVQQRLINA
ncbi:putative alpha-1,2-galactosyltransferase gmh1, partial [Neolecta irregularis DAH-3]